MRKTAKKVVKKTATKKKQSKTIAKKTAKKTTKVKATKVVKIAKVKKDKVPTVRYSEGQKMIFGQVEKKLGKKIDLVKYASILPTTDEIEQMGNHSSVAWLVREFTLLDYTTLQREIAELAVIQNRHDMNFKINLDSMPTDKQIVTMGKEAAVDYVVKGSNYWAGAM